MGKTEEMAQNLRDAGCGEETIRRCLACLGAGRREELLRRLERHRSGLLEKVHEGERQIACLDYLVFRLEHRSLWRAEGKPVDSLEERE